MDLKQKQLETLLKLVDERDLTYLDYNKALSGMLQDTMLTAVVELLDVPTDQLEWLELSVSSSVLVLIMAVMYNPCEDTSPLLGPIPPDSNAVLIQKTLHIGLPLEMVFESSEIIKEFLLGVAHDDAVSEQTTNVQTPTPVTFDSSSLSKDQLSQMMAFQHLDTGSKQ